MAISLWIKDQILKLLAYEKRPRELAIACSLGIYIAFNPFIGFHTVMIFAVSWLFGLSFPVIFSISLLLHNPWTVIPVYGAGYMCGDWVLNALQINHISYNPSWVTYLNQWIEPYVGTSQISFWAFMVGGNLLGIVLAVGLYPVINWFITQMIVTQKNDPVVATGAVHAPEPEQGPLVPSIARLARRAYEANSPK